MFSEFEDKAPEIREGEIDLFRQHDRPGRSLTAVSARNASQPRGAWINAGSYSRRAATVIVVEQNHLWLWLFQSFGRSVRIREPRGFKAISRWLRSSATTPPVTISMDSDPGRGRSGVLLMPRNAWGSDVIASITLK
jgi:hypothetical protein